MSELEDAIRDGGKVILGGNANTAKTVAASQGSNASWKMHRCDRLKICTSLWNDTKPTRKNRRKKTE